MTQHLLTRRNFLFLNSLKGFPRSLGQRPHFIDFIGCIDFIDSFDSLLALSILSHHYQPSFVSFVMLVHEAQPAILTGSLVVIKSFAKRSKVLVAVPLCKVGVLEFLFGLHIKRAPC